ncbi:MAG: Zn-binding domain-containing protein, partial [Thermodesulfobacteriota bacterium]
VITTNALELGIDIGDLDLCILSGHPGTLASFWQQAGRVGRKGNSALIVYVARDAPVDQYLVHHPDFVTSSPVEEAWLSADNPYILLQHLPCAAHEHPLRPEEPLFQSSTYEQARETLKEDKTVVPYRDSFRYALSDYPARGVNLRGLTDYNVEIFCGSEVIGEIDPIGARGTLYKDAIYQHLGRRYMSMDLNLEQKLCRVEPVNVDYYTEAVWEKRIVMNEVEETRSLHASELRFGYITVNKQPKLYKKIRERTFENIGYGPITLPAFEYETTGFSLVPSLFLREGLDGVDKRYLGAGLFGLSYILRRAAPSLCMGDTTDIHTDVSLADEADASWKSALFVYDAIEGGVGFSERICERIDEALELCLRIIRECECRSGCPACVPPLPPGIENDELSQLLVESNAAVECTVSLIRNLLTGELVLPDIRFERSPLPEPVEPPPVDEEALQLQKRLRKASGILKKKRDRLH